jgi:hypothetical protein
VGWLQLNLEKEAMGNERGKAKRGCAVGVGEKDEGGEGVGGKVRNS